MYVLSASIRKAISKSMQRITKDESGMRPTAVSSAKNEARSKNAAGPLIATICVLKR